MPAKQLTAEQKADADRLKAKFKAWQSARKDRGEQWSQDWAGDQLVFGQSTLNQYLNGKIPLNPEAANKFAGLLGCKVADFSAAIDTEIRDLTTGIDKNKFSPAQAVARLTGPRWPFERIDPAKIGNLGHDDAMRLEGAILLAAAQLKIDIERPESGKRKAA